MTIRNPRDSRFFPGNEPAGIKGITKPLLEFIKNHVNPIGFGVGGSGRPKEEYEPPDKDYFLYDKLEHTIDHDEFFHVELEGGDVSQHLYDISDDYFHDFDHFHDESCDCDPSVGAPSTIQDFKTKI